MSFKDLIERYKEGNVTEEERQFVESEIEKNESINEFLSDEIDLNLDINNNDIGDDEIDNNKIKNAINRKFRKVTIISIVSVFIILLGAKYIVSPIVDSIYYNPNRKSSDEYFRDIEFDMNAYVELYLPGYALSYAYAEPLGFGKYDISIGQRDLFEDNDLDTKISLVRNKKYGNFLNLINDQGFFYRNLDHEMKEGPNFQSEEAINHLRELPSTSYVAAYVDFKEDLSMEELISLQEEFKDPQNSNVIIDFKWVAVRVISDEMLVNTDQGKKIDGRYIIVDRVGFIPNFNDAMNLTHNAAQEKYPCFSLMEFVFAKNYFNDWNREMAEAYEIHFKSLLQYLYDRKKFTASLDKRSIQGDFYANSLEYIEENGVKTYGVLVYGEAKDIISFMEREETDCIYISDIKVSKYSK